MQFEINIPYYTRNVTKTLIVESLDTVKTQEYKTSKGTLELTEFKVESSIKGIMRKWVESLQPTSYDLELVNKKHSLNKNGRNLSYHKRIQKKWNKRYGYRLFKGVYIKDIKLEETTCHLILDI